MSKNKVNDEKHENTIKQMRCYYTDCKKRFSDNGTKIIELGFKVNMRDKVLVNNKIISPEKKQYILLNKPKGTICTKSDPQERKTVLDLLPAELKHLNPVGRLDRNTTGVLLLTNDGELTQKLLHPTKKVTKVYKALLDRHISMKEMEKLADGIELDDGEAHFDKISVTGNTISRGASGSEVSIFAAEEITASGAITAGVNNIAINSGSSPIT